MVCLPFIYWDPPSEKLKLRLLWTRGADRNFKLVVKNQNYVPAMAMIFIKWKGIDNMVYQCCMIVWTYGFQIVDYFFTPILLLAMYLFVFIILII